MSPLTLTGDVTHCSPSPSSEGEITCNRLATSLSFPNGILRAADNNIYVPTTAHQGILVYKPSFSASNPTESSLDFLHQIAVDYPIDNMSQDQNGDFYLAAFPKLMQVLAPDEHRKGAPASTILKVSKKSAGSDNGRDGGWEVTKVIEDRDGEVLPSASTVVHDPKTGRLWVIGRSTSLLSFDVREYFV